MINEERRTGKDQREWEYEKWEQNLTWTLTLSVNSLPIRILFLFLIFIFPLPVLITHSRIPVLGGSQWSGGFYGYRLKFWLFYDYRVIFFSYRVNKKLKANFLYFKKLNINKPDFFSIFKRKIKVFGPSRDKISRSYEKV